jgi:WD40 repeat protein
LSAFDEWAAGHPSDVEPLERQFLEAAKTLASKQLAAARRSNRRLRALTALLMVLILAVGTIAVLLFRASQNVTQQRDIAVSRQLITESEHLSAPDPVTAKLKSLAAWRIHPSDDAWQAMLAAVSLPGIAVMTGHTDAVGSVAFSPDGKTLASGSAHNTVQLWAVTSHRQIGPPLTAHKDALDSVAFSPDGKSLTSGSADSFVWLWGIPHLDDPVSFICRSVRRSFTGDEWQSIVPPGPKYRALCP